MIEFNYIKAKSNLLVEKNKRKDGKNHFPLTNMLKFYSLFKRTKTTDSNAKMTSAIGLPVWYTVNGFEDEGDSFFTISVLFLGLVSLGMILTTDVSLLFAILISGRSQLVFA